MTNIASRAYNAVERFYEQQSGCLGIVGSVGGLLSGGILGFGQGIVYASEHCEAMSSEMLAYAGIGLGIGAITGIIAGHILGATAECAVVSLEKLVANVRSCKANSSENCDENAA